MEEPDDPLPLVPLGDLFALVFERPGVVKIVAGLLGLGLALRLFVAIVVGSATGNPLTGLFLALGLVPLVLLAGSLPLQRYAPTEDVRTAAQIWRWGEAAVAGTVPHVVLVVWLTIGTLLSGRY